MEQNNFFIFNTNKENNHNIVINVIKMFINRGILEKSKFEQYIEYAIEQYKQTQKYIETNIIVKDDIKIYIKILDINSYQNFKIDDVKNIISDINSYKIIISPNINIKNTAELEKINNLQLFPLNFFDFDKAEHRLIPKHEKVDDDIEIQNILSVYGKDGMKKIKIDDPMCKYHNFKKNDLIRIIRFNQITGYDIDYRIVID